ncbi:DUF1776 domain-containing protein [Laspinema sp. D1]|uniref:hypothetical protein n=1 Tax=Laspinema palackyanum TaxID=3231601 RepID=UPI00347E6B66|nr:DUF1776 domain-containing protein [Laspinema sp. D2b]
MLFLDQTQRIELEDVFVPVQGGIVNDVIINIKPANGVTDFANVVPVTNFAKSFLNNYPNPNEFYENVSQNLTAAIFNNAEILGLAGKTDTISVELIREPISALPYPFVSESIKNAAGTTDQITQLEVKNLVIPVQGGTITNATISLDFLDNVAAFPDITPLANFTQSYLTNYANPNDFYENVTQNLAATIINNTGAFGLTGILNSLSVELERGPNGALPHPFTVTSTGTFGAGYDSTVRVEIEDLFVPVQGGTVNDVVLTIDQVNGLAAFPDINPVTNFIKSYLGNYPNPNDFYENINKNLTAEIFNNAEELGLAGTMDSLSIQLTREPIAALPYTFVTENIRTAGGTNQQIVQLELEDLLIPVQGGTVADGTLTLDFVDNLEAFPDIRPLTNFTQDYLTNYANPNDFYEIVSQNLTTTVLNNAEALGLAGIIDSLSLDLRRGPNAGLPHPFITTSTALPLAPSNPALATSESLEMFTPDFSNELALV